MTVKFSYVMSYNINQYLKQTCFQNRYLLSISYFLKDEYLIIL